MDLGREVFRGTIAKVLQILVSMGGVVIFARVLGPTSFGGVYLLFTLVAFLDRPMMGWSFAGKKRISEDESIASQALGSILLFNLSWLCLVGIVTLWTSDWLYDFTGIKNAGIFFVSVMATASVVSTLWVLMEGRGRISASVWSSLTNRISTLSSQFVLLLFGFGAAGLLYGRILGAVLFVPLYVYILGVTPTVPDRSTVWSFWEYAKYAIPSELFSRLYDRLDMLILGLLLSPTVAGYYEIAWKVATPAIVLAEVGSSGLMTRVSSREAAGKSYKQDLNQIISLTSLVAIPMLFGALFLADFIVLSFFGEAYAPAAPLLIGLCLYQVVRSQSLPLMQTLSGRDDIESAMYLSGVAMTLNAVLGVVLTLEYGPIGVVASTIVAESSRYLGSVFFVRQFLPNFVPINRLLMLQVGSGLIMGMCILLVKTLLTEPTIGNTLLLVILGAVIYAALLLIVSEEIRNQVVIYANKTPISV